MRYIQKNKTLKIGQNEAADQLMCIIDSAKKFLPDDFCTEIHLLVNHIVCFDGKVESRSIEVLDARIWRDQIFRSMSYLRIYDMGFINTIRELITDAIDYEVNVRNNQTK
jgi:hypothetical protein